jgi:hypothetical protein
MELLSHVTYSRNNVNLSSNFRRVTHYELQTYQAIEITLHNSRSTVGTCSAYRGNKLCLLNIIQYPNHLELLK